MSYILAPLVLLSGLALIAWHMVRPNFRDLRISVAEFLPDFDQSQARRNRISLAVPLRSLPFLLRLLILAAVIAALWSHLLPPPPATATDTEAHLRIILDGSPSMALADRPAQTRQAVEELTSSMVDAQDSACVDVVDVTHVPAVIPSASLASRLSGPTEMPDGVTAQAILAAIATDLRNPDCPGPVTHVAVVSDLPPMPALQSQFDGPSLWWQIGAPLANDALETVQLLGGGLAAVAPTLMISAHRYGTAPRPPKLGISKDGRRIEKEMTPDLSRDNGWTLPLPYPGPGTLSVALVEGGAYQGDDRLRVRLPAIDRIAVDWQVPGMPRPAAFTEGGATDPLIARHDAGQQVPTDRPVVLLYDGWDQQSTGADIGAFVQDHPLLDQLNFDVLEPRLPVGLSQLPVGFDAVLLDGSSGGRAILAMRDQPVGVLMPAPSEHDANTQALSWTLLGNALRLALSPSGAGNLQKSRLEITRLDADGAEIANPLWESDTNRARTDPPDLTGLGTTARRPETARQEERDNDWVPWLALIAALALLAERAVALRWRAA